MDEFVKHDNNKADLTLLPYYSLEAAARVAAFGAQKYSRENWRGGTAERYVAAALRHLHAWSDATYEDTDGESGESHLAHALCCVLFSVELEKNNSDG